MPYMIIDEGSGLVFRFSGDVPFEEIMVANKNGWEHPRWDKHQYQIWDFEKVETFGMDENEALASAYMDNVHARHTKLIKVAFVTDNKHINKTLQAYIAAIDSENFEAQVFANEADARKWVSG